MGHALNGTLQDVLIRMRRMQGRRALWALGTDHAGIATQVVVERALAREGTTARSSAARPSRRASGSGREQYGSTIVEQYKRLGASCDYERERFTMDDALRPGGDEGLQGPLRQGLHLPRQLHGELGPGLGSRSPTSRSSTARSRTRCTTSTIRWSRGTATSRSRQCGPRRCWPTSRSPCNPNDSRYAAMVGQTVDLAARRPAAADHRGPICRPRVRHGRAQDHARATTRTTSRSAAGTGSRRSR